jgi:uncharacterized membrane protein
MTSTRGQPKGKCRRLHAGRRPMFSLAVRIGALSLLALSSPVCSLLASHPTRPLHPFSSSLHPQIRTPFHHPLRIIPTSMTHAHRHCHCHLNRSHLPLHMSLLLTGDATTSMSHPNDLYLAFWMATFASSHIGMSAVRDRLIGACGDAMDKVGLVNTGFQLPTWWPGDEAGNQLFPTRESAGRQGYRAGYTAVSFTTLGFSAFYYYSMTALTTHPISISSSSLSLFLSPLEYDFYLCVAAASFGAAIASLFNASPLSLMPGFTATTNTSMDRQESSSLPLQRNDLLKLSPKGLTRITRHPLILPVVPWGIATCQLQGSHTADVLLFGGLTLYSVLGCAAQDLRIIRQEGSVGTSFSDNSLDSLQDFYQSTSFVPFGAVWDGRQSMSDIIEEIPWLGFAGGCVVGVYLEHAILTFGNGLAVVAA